MNILLCGSDSQSEYLPQVRDFLLSLRTMHINVCVEHSFADYLSMQSIPLDGFRIVDSMPEDTELVVSMGATVQFCVPPYWSG